MGPSLYSALWRGKGETGRPALRCGDRSLTFGELFEEILRAEAGLRALGVGPGDLVTIFSLNTPETVAAVYAADRIGAAANFVDLKAGPEEIAPYLRLAGSRVVLVLEAAFSKVYRSRGDAPAERFVVLPLGPSLSRELAEKLRAGAWRETAGADCLSWEELLRVPSEPVPPESERWEEPAVIVYTGGTTGPAKGVTLSRRAFRASLEQYTAAETEYGPGGTALSLLPVFSAFGLCQCIHVPLCLGMTVVLAPMFRPGQLGEYLLRYRPEQVNATTSYWQLLLRREDIRDLSFLRIPRCGGDVILEETERRVNGYLAARGCPAPLVIEYGMSEVCGIVCLSYGPDRREGTVGRPAPGCRILAADPDTGRALPPGEQGELIILSETVMSGYYGRPEADRQVLRLGPGGLLWIWTGDLGHVEADGTVTVTGRTKRMISRSGFKIFPVVIENCLLEDGEVEACAVVGSRGPGGEELPVAHVVLRRGSDPVRAEARLLALCRRKLNRFLVPSAFRFQDALPLTERGKLDYLRLERETVL